MMLVETGVSPFPNINKAQRVYLKVLYLTVVQIIFPTDIFIKILFKTFNFV